MKPVKMAATLFGAIAIFFALATSASAQDGIKLRISSQETYVGVPIILSIQVDNADGVNPPELPQVDGLDIKLEGTPARSVQVFSINGKTTRTESVVYRYRITPRREGTFVIPSFTIPTGKGAAPQTEPIRIVASKSETGDLLFAEVSGQKEKIYVGEPIELTLRIWLKPFEDQKLGVKLSPVDMFRLLSARSEFGAFQTALEKLGEDEEAVRVQRVLRKDKSGKEHEYYLYEMDATFYPKSPGKLELDDVQIVVDYPTRLAKTRDPFEEMMGSSFFNDDFFRSRFSGFGSRLRIVDSRPIVATPEVEPIKVVPIPTEGRPADYRGAVGQYIIVTTATPKEVKAGDPITLQIGIRGTGPMELVQAPPLAELPSLVADFKVPDEPLAGIVQGDIKVFKTTIRPRREGVDRIPPIPFSYFDPAKEEFVTVTSEPIPIKVEKAEKLVLDAIVNRRDSSTPSSDSARESGPVFENLEGPSLLKATSHAPGFRFWLAVMAVPPVLLGLVGLYLGRSGRGPKHSGGRRKALGQIAHATDARGVSAALLGLIAQRLGQPTASLTRPEAMVRLSDQVDAATRERLDHLLGECENAAFAGSGGVPLSELKSEARQLVGALARISPPRGERLRPRFENPRRVAAMVVLGVGLTLATVASFWLAFQMQAKRSVASLKEERVVTLEPEQQAVLLQEANQAYKQAMDAKEKDAAEANEAFAEAAQKYQTLVDSGIDNPKLYFNLGNAYLQKGELGRAIANYRRAVKQRPLWRAASRNLAYAQQLLDGETSDEISTMALMTEQVRQWFVSRTPRFWVAWLAVGWIGFWLGALVKMLWPRFWTKAIVIPATVLVLAVTGWLYYQSQQPSPLPTAVVVVDQAPVYQGSGEAFGPVSDLKMSEGEQVEVLQRRGDWFQIRNSLGKQGWAKAELLETV